MPHCAAIVCHDEQLDIWAGEVLDDMSEIVRDDFNYDELVHARRALRSTILDIVSTAFEMSDAHNKGQS